MARDEKVLITGATGFVGRHLRVALRTLSHPLRLASRQPDLAATHEAGDWVHLDAEKPETFYPALRGCAAAYYLIHQIRETGDYVESETRSAEAFAEAAAQAGLRRIVYLGGVAPQGRPSPHLLSRLRTGEILRQGTVSTVEVRAAMIIGAGSLSWQIVRDLAARLPAMILPRWLRFHSWPVAIDDALAALLVALDLPASQGRCYDLPGPERMSHEGILRRTAARFGKRPLMLDVPVLTPRLSSYWIRLVTDVDLKLAQELVQGLTSDLDPSQPLFWPLLSQREPMSVDQAITHALADELRGGVAAPATRRRIGEISNWYLERAADER